MFKVKNNAITITRGDSGIAEITLQTAEGEEYTPQEGDSIRFALLHKDIKGGVWN